MLVPVFPQQFEIFVNFFVLINIYYTVYQYINNLCLTTFNFQLSSNTLSFYIFTPLNNHSIFKKNNEDYAVRGPQETSDHFYPR